jgi:hypothetical protein
MSEWVLSLATYNGELIAAGDFAMAGGVSASSIAAWDGAAWRPLGSGLSDWVETLTVFDGELIAGGWFTGAAGQGAGFIAAWRGCTAPCYANCDDSTIEPILNVADFSCFLSRFAAQDPYANCDQSTLEPTLNIADFSCFLQKFAAGCQ